MVKSAARPVARFIEAHPLVSLAFFVALMLLALDDVLKIVGTFIALLLPIALLGAPILAIVYVVARFLGLTPRQRKNQEAEAQAEAQAIYASTYHPESTYIEPTAAPYYGPSDTQPIRVQPHGNH